MKKVLDYIFFTRPVLFPPVWTIVILGVRAADLREGSSPIVSTGIAEIDWTLVLLLALLACLYAGVYAFNQIHDMESDRRNSKLFFLADGMISVSSAYVFTAFLDLVAVAGGFYISTRVGLLFAVILILGILYSHPMTNFKGKPSPGYWSNAFGHGMVPFLIGWAYIDHISLEAAIKSLAYLCGVGAIYLNTTLPDREGDKAVGKITHGVRWGVRGTMRASTFLVVLSIIFAQMAGDHAYFIAGVIALPFFVLPMRTRNMGQIVLSTKVAILALSLFACIYFPLYTLVLVIGFFLSRSYYRSRFRLDYPTVT
jgi:4-hydroxybenzoate polyprenyltransferase